MTRLLNSKNEHLGYGLVFFSGILWGLSGFFVKRLQGLGADSSLISFMRVSIAFVAMLVFCVAKFGFKSLIISQKQIFVCAALGLICHGVYNLFYNFAITTLGISFSTVILYLSPAMTLIFSAIVYKEKINIIKILAILVNILGCGFTITNGRLNISGFVVSGLVAAVGACICYSMNSIIGKMSDKGTNPFVMSMYSFFFAAIVLLVIVKPWEYRVTLQTTGVVEWGVLYALIPTAITYAIYYIGIQKVKDCSKVPVLASVEVVVASVVGVTLFGEHMGSVSIMGIAMVIASIVMMNTHFYKDIISLNAAK